LDTIGWYGKQNRHGVSHVPGDDENRRIDYWSFQLALRQKGDRAMMVRMARIGMKSKVQPWRGGQGKEEEKENDRRHREFARNATAENCDWPNLSHFHGLSITECTASTAN
jgi:hypothetical protein